MVTQESVSLEFEKQLFVYLKELYPHLRTEDLVTRFLQLCQAYRSPSTFNNTPTTTPWYLDHQQVGYILYADLFCPEAQEWDKLKAVADHLQYLSDLGVTFVHILPILQSSGDAGFAVDDYRTIDPRYGTHYDFRRLIETAHSLGIRIVFDFVLNHTSDNHAWAKAAKQGDEFYQNFYIFDDKGEQWPEVSDVFREFAPGHWDYVPVLNKWVWATFYQRHPGNSEQEVFPFAQWDLNYKNPEVFFAMLENLFYLASMGIDVFRLDAVGFIWKEKGTPCKHLPQVHSLLRLFKAGLSIVSPNAIFLGELRDRPHNMSKYLGADQLQLVYNFDVMCYLWWTATHADSKKLIEAFNTSMFTLTPDSQALLLTECHDEVSIKSGDEATDQGLFEYFQKQGAFEQNTIPDKLRPRGVAGTTWSLLGGNTDLMLVLEAMKFTLTGIPLLYMGEELAVENDLTYRNDPQRMNDERFIKRIPLTMKRKERRFMPGTKEYRLYRGIQELIVYRKKHPSLIGRPHFFDTGNSHVLGYSHEQGNDRVQVLLNFSGESQEAVFAHGIPVTLTPYEWRFLG